MTRDFAEGDAVKWNWGSGTGTGKVARKCTRKVTKTISGAEITRNASAEVPAYLVRQEDGDEALKSGHELAGA